MKDQDEMADHQDEQACEDAKQYPRDQFLRDRKTDTLEGLLEDY